MSPLRMRMIEDMKLAGLAAGTQATYIDAVRKLAASPDQLSEEEARGYLVRLRERGAACGTYYDIQFLYRYTLDREWVLFSKNDSSAETETPALRAFQCRGPQLANKCPPRIPEIAKKPIGDVLGAHLVGKRKLGFHRSLNSPDRYK